MALLCLLCFPLKLSALPAPWKHVNLSFIPNIGEPNNYRSISLTTATSKVFEAIIFDQLGKFLEQNVSFNKINEDSNVIVLPVIRWLSSSTSPWLHWTTPGNHTWTHLISSRYSTEFDMKIWQKCSYSNSPPKGTHFHPSWWGFCTNHLLQLPVFARLGTHAHVPS